MSGSDILSQAKLLKVNLEKSKLEQAKLAGQIQALKEQLQRDFGVDTVEAAQIKLGEFASDLEALAAEREKLVGELEGIMKEAGK